MPDKVCVLWPLVGNSKHRSFAFSAKRMVTTRRVFPTNVLRLGEGGDFEALHCQPSTNFDKCTRLDLTT
jgi:hypothetical protein